MPIIISTTDEEEARDLHKILTGSFGRPYRIYIRGREFDPEREPDPR